MLNELRRINNAILGNEPTLENVISESKAAISGFNSLLSTFKYRSSAWLKWSEYQPKNLKLLGTAYSHLDGLLINLIMGLLESHQNNRQSLKKIRDLQYNLNQLSKKHAAARKALTAADLSENRPKDEKYKKLVDKEANLKAALEKEELNSIPEQHRILLESISHLSESFLQTSRQFNAISDAGLNIPKELEFDNIKVWKENSERQLNQVTKNNLKLEKNGSPAQGIILQTKDSVPNIHDSPNLNDIQRKMVNVPALPSAQHNNGEIQSVAGTHVVKGGRPLPDFGLSLDNSGQRSLDPRINQSTSKGSLDPRMNQSTSKGSLDPRINQSTSKGSLDPRMNQSTSMEQVDQRRSLDPRMNQSTSMEQVEQRRSLDPRMVPGSSHSIMQTRSSIQLSTPQLTNQQRMPLPMQSNSSMQYQESPPNQEYNVNPQKSSNSNLQNRSSYLSLSNWTPNEETLPPLAKTDFSTLYRSLDSVGDGIGYSNYKTIYQREGPGKTNETTSETSTVRKETFETLRIKEPVSHQYAPSEMKCAFCEQMVPTDDITEHLKLKCKTPT